MLAAVISERLVKRYTVLGMKIRSEMNEKQFRDSDVKNDSGSDSPSETIT